MNLSINQSPLVNPILEKNRNVTYRIILCCSSVSIALTTGLNHNPNVLMVTYLLVSVDQISSAHLSPATDTFLHSPYEYANVLRPAWVWLCKSGRFSGSRRRNNNTGARGRKRVEKVGGADVCYGIRDNRGS